MIKVEVLKKKGAGATTLVFEARQTTTEGLEELDDVYSALLGSRAKRGGYLGSNRFEIEVRDESTET